MQGNADGREELLTAVARCPIPDCATLMLAYRSPMEIVPRGDGAWEFICPRCGCESIVARQELIFQSVPTSWLLATAHEA